MTLMVGTPAAGARIISDVVTTARGDFLSSLRRIHGDPRTWTVNIGEIMSVVSSAEELTVTVLVMGSTGICRLTSGSVLLAACAVDVAIGARQEIQFKVRLRSRRSKSLADATVIPVVWPDIDNLRFMVNTRNIDGTSNSTLSNGSTLATVENNGTLANQFTQISAGLRPTYVTNQLGGTHPVIRFVGDSIRFNQAASTGHFMADGSGCTIYIVYKRITGGSTVFLGTTGGGERGFLFWDRTPVDGSVGFYLYSSTIKIDLTSAANVMNTTQFNIVRVRVSSAGTPDVRIDVGGTSVASGNVTSFNTVTDFPLEIGGAPDTGFNANFDLAHLMIYAGDHDDTLSASVVDNILKHCGVSSFPAS